MTALLTSPPAQADVYSFGVLLWEVITMKTPYEDLQAHALRLPILVASGTRPTVCTGTAAFPRTRDLFL